MVSGCCSNLDGHNIVGNQQKQISFTNTIGMQLLMMESGTFIMGDPKARRDEPILDLPAHLVVITKPFYISQTEITQGQWVAVMGYNNSLYRGDDLPVESISWEEAFAFCTLLSKLDNNQYRLPTEAEWEIACKAGSNSSYGWMKAELQIDSFCWYKYNSALRTHSVKSKRPNPNGLYDIIGNVAEYVNNWHFELPIAFDRVSIDPKAPVQGQYKVVRGSSYDSLPIECTTTARFGMRPTEKYNFVGFRVVCVVPAHAPVRDQGTPTPPSAPSDDNGGSPEGKN